MQKWANIIMSVEVMVPVPNETVEGSYSDKDAYKHLETTVKNGNWFNISGSRVIHIAEEK